MAYDGFDDEDEDWHDDDDEPDDEQPAPCPECGGPVHSVADRCPACGYWLSDSDRRGMRIGAAKPRWIRITTIVVLVAMMLGLLVGGAAFF